MSSEIQRFDDPESIREKRFCLSALSKNLKGELELKEIDQQKCGKPNCLTLKTFHQLAMSVEGESCDSKLGRLLDGRLAVHQLVTAFDEDGMHRGFHSGDFTWSASGVEITGRMFGMTNVGTHRAPAFKECQRCDQTGVMEGRLCGQVVETKHEELKGCQIVAAYRMSFEPSEKGGGGEMRGVIEGVTICFCQE